jgi:hypothetical protein
VLAFPGVSRIFPADAALGLSLRIIGEKNTAVNTILGQGPGAKRYILTTKDPETIHISRVIFLRMVHGAGLQARYKNRTVRFTGWSRPSGLR